MYPEQTTPTRGVVGSESELGTALTQMENAIEALDKTVAQLEQRLSPVLRPEGPQAPMGKTSDTPQPQGAPLTERITRCTEAIGRLQHTLLAVMQRSAT